MKQVPPRPLAYKFTGVFSGLCTCLQAGLAKFVKHTAAIVVRADKGFVDLVRAMAAGVLKTLAVWVEKEIAGGEKQAERQQLVVKVGIRLQIGRKQL